jgi:hypothetical protein
MDFKTPKGHTMHPEMVSIIRWQFEEWKKNQNIKKQINLEKIEEDLSVLAHPDREIDNIKIQITKQNSAGYFTLN